MKDPLFFIALLPDEDIQREVTAFKQACASRYNASHSLKTPPHLTLIPPFPWPQTRLGELDRSLKEFVRKQDVFKIELNGFNCFPPRVLFVDVVQNEELKQLQMALFLHLKTTVRLEDERGNRFHPHMTIAHRDLKPGIFPAAWEHFSSQVYQRIFQADRLTLLEHVNRRWQLYNEYFFGA